VAPVVFNRDGLPVGFDYARFEVWSPYDSCQGQAGSGKPNQTGPPRTYAMGDLVMYNGDLFQLNSSSSTAEAPSATPAKWTKLPPPVDDLRLVPGSPYAGMGLLDTLE
jgi:hypothetical protein